MWVARAVTGKVACMRCEAVGWGDKTDLSAWAVVHRVATGHDHYTMLVGYKLDWREEEKDGT